MKSFIYKFALCVLITILMTGMVVKAFPVKRIEPNNPIRTEITELKTDKIVLPFAISGREAHLSEEEATQRAVRTIENEIRKQFQSKVYSLF